jgi:hypothetical protein
MKLALTLLAFAALASATPTFSATAWCGTQAYSGGSCSLTGPTYQESVSSFESPWQSWEQFGVSTLSGGSGGTQDGSIATGLLTYTQTEEMDGVGTGIATLDLYVCVSGTLPPNGWASVTFGQTKAWYGDGCGHEELTTPFNYAVPFDLSITVESSESSIDLGEGEQGQSFVAITGLTLPPDPPLEQSSVPEPKAWMLAGGGLVIMLLLRGMARRNRIGQDGDWSA